MTTPCPHLEKLIQPKTQEPSFESTHKVKEGDIDKSYYTSGAGIVMYDKLRSGYYEGKFRDRLRRAGLSEIHIDILTLRFVYDSSIRDIVKELNVVSYGTVLTLLKEGLTQFKQYSLKRGKAK